MTLELLTIEYHPLGSSWITILGIGDWSLFYVEWNNGVEWLSLCGVRVI